MFNMNQTEPQTTNSYAMYHNYLHPQYYHHQTTVGPSAMNTPDQRFSQETTPSNPHLTPMHHSTEIDQSYYSWGMSQVSDDGSVGHSTMSSPGSWGEPFGGIMGAPDDQGNFYQPSGQYHHSSNSVDQQNSVAATVRQLESSSSSSRIQRNHAEKMRRDKINNLIAELGKLVPLVFNSPKRVDKTSILRLTSTYLRIKQFQKTYKKLKGKHLAETTVQQHHNNGSGDDCRLDDDSRLQSASPSSCVESSEDNIPVDSVVKLVCDQLGGFLMVLSTTGKIIMVSQMVETLLERSSTDLMGQSLYDITHQDDHHRLRHQLSHNSNQMPDDTGGSMRRNFNIRIARSRPRSEPVTYESVSISGVIMPNEYLICIVKVCKPAPLYEQLLEARKDEYVTRHLVDGRIVNCDQRISVVAGYMTHEVAGLSAFRFMHREDVRWTMIALRQMYDRGESRGSSCYRLMTRTGEFIYLRTCGYLEVDSQGLVESFVCVNTLVTEIEGKQLIKEMKQRYSALILPSTNGNSSITSSTNDVFVETSTTTHLISTNGNGVGSHSTHNKKESVEDPSQLELAIQYLMHKLPGSPGSPAEEKKDCYNDNNNTISSACSTITSICTSGSDSSPPTPKRLRVESPRISSSISPDMVMSPQLYAQSVHPVATCSLDRQMIKEQEHTYQSQQRKQIRKEPHKIPVPQKVIPSSSNGAPNRTEPPL